VFDFDGNKLGGDKRVGVKQRKRARSFWKRARFLSCV